MVLELIYQMVGGLVNASLSYLAGTILLYIIICIKRLCGYSSACICFSCTGVMFLIFYVNNIYHLTASMPNKEGLF